MRQKMLAARIQALHDAPVQGCTRQTLRCGTARDYGHALNDCCRGHIVRIVRDTMALFAEFGIVSWLDYGTLLGAVRNPMTTKADYPWLDQSRLPDGPIPPGVVPHDKDADIGVYTTDWSKLMRVAAALNRKGYQAVVRHHSALIKVRLSQRNHTNLDVFSWALDSRGTLRRRTYIRVDQFKGRDFPAAWVADLRPVPWEGMELMAPADPEAFCEFRYGPKWRTPVAANHDGVRR